MKKGIIFLTSVLWGFFLPLAHAENNVAAIASAVQQTDTAPQRGSLYRVRHEHNTAYLFGTIHVGKPSFFPLEAEVTRALIRAGKLVVEIDIRNERAFQEVLKKHGLYPGGDRIDRHVSAASLRQLRQALEGFRIPFDAVANMKPWLLANMLIVLDLERHGYQRSQGVEHFLLAFADKQEKTVQELESAEHQLSLFDSMKEADQEQYLLENLAQIADGTALKKSQALIDAWSTANGKALDQLLQESLNEKTVSSEFVHRVLLDKRNAEMAEKIEALLKSEESVFVAVGLFHLMGTTGLPELLRQRGYEVEKLY